MSQENVQIINNKVCLVSAVQYEPKKAYSGRKTYGDLRKVPKRKQREGIDHSSKKGKICGANHFSLTEEGRKRVALLNKINILKRDVFYMVDGIDVIEQEIDSINTNSGVLTMDHLNNLQ